ncbi:MAG: hypothetical protein ACLQVI_25925 [Polyangiaceae bacterium]|jgi:hypothetical protein
MQLIDFYKLSRSIQERFIGSVNGTGLPAPILRTNDAPRTPLMWFGASAAALLILLLFFRLGYGDLASGMAVQGTAWMILYVALVALAVFGVLRALAILREHRKSPFRRGVYVFPVGLIDARQPTLRLYPIEDLGNVVGPDGASFKLEFGPASFVFPVKDAEHAESAKTALASARGKVEDADAARESMRPKALAALDPLQGFANPLMSSDPLTPSAPPWAERAWMIALGAGAVVGGSIWAIHNAKSDDAMYERAIAQGDADGYRAYLARGSRHTSEIATILLPRAELVAAVKVGTVAAIEQYAKDHPRTNIGPEVAAALKAALVKELGDAVQVGTLAAIDDFTRRHPQSHLDADVSAARHRVYQAALDRYLQQAPTKSPAELAFVQRLVAWAEAKGPPVEVRFHRLTSKTMDKADGAVEKHRMFRGVVSDPSRYFDASHAKPNEDALAAAVVQGFAHAFPTEIVALAVGEPIADPDAPLPAQITVPTLFVEYGPSWSGSMVASGNPRGIFVGLELSFTALFRVPDDTKPLKVHLDVWKVPDTAAAKGDDKPEENVYSKMQQDAFAQFQKRLLGAFFRPASSK